MPAPDSAARHDDLDEIASSWLARRDAGLTPAEAIELQAWLDADPRHAAVWRDFEVSWRLFDQPRGHGTTAAMVATLGVRRRHRLIRRTAAACTLAAAALLVLLNPFQRAENNPHAAGTQVVILRPKLQTLPDGSKVELNSGAEIEIAYSPASRRVKLLRGDAHFTVEKDASRPFIVAAQGVEVRAVGTAFLVKSSAGSVDVVVTHGTVAVNRTAVPSAAPVRPVTLEIGDHLHIPAKNVAKPDPVLVAQSSDTQKLLDWRGPRLELSGMRLGDAVQIFNRENRVKIRIADEQLAEMKLSGIFRIDNAEGLVRLLQDNYGLLVYRDTDLVILREAR